MPDVNYIKKIFSHLSSIHFFGGDFAVKYFYFEVLKRFFCGMVNEIA
jgi:hypothetical protein